MILSVPPYTPSESDKLQERHIESTDAWCDKSIGELNLPKDVLIAMIIRNAETIIPDGKTVVKEGDTVVMYQ